MRRTLHCWLAVLLLLAVPLGAEDDEAAVRLLGARESLARGLTAYEAEPERAMPFFEEVVSAFASATQAGTLTDDARAVLAQALEWKGRTLVNLGQKEAASAAFRALVELSPAHDLDRQQVSPKIVELFDTVRKEIVGTLAVSSDPVDATVKVDGREAGRTPATVPVKAGTYEIEIGRPGWTTEKRTVTVAARASEVVAVTLSRVSANVFFVTEPAGVEIWVDGSRRATSDGALDPSLHDVLRARGLDPTKASARTVVGDLAPGAHALEFRKACHETLKRQIDGYAQACRTQLQGEPQPTP